MTSRGLFYTNILISSIFVYKMGIDIYFCMYSITSTYQNRRHYRNEAIFPFTSYSYYMLVHKHTKLEKQATQYNIQAVILCYYYTTSLYVTYFFHTKRRLNYRESISRLEFMGFRIDHTCHSTMHKWRKWWYLYFGSMPIQKYASCDLQIYLTRKNVQFSLYTCTVSHLSLKKIRDLSEKPFNTENVFLIAQ